MKAKLYSGGVRALPGMESYAGVARADLSRVNFGDGLDLSGFSAADVAEIGRRHAALKKMERLVEKGMSLPDAIEEIGESRSTYYSWRGRFRRSGGNPASLISRSRARKTPPARASWTPHVENFVMSARNEYMVGAKDLAYVYALLHPEMRKVSWRTMARIIAYLRDEKGLICPAERGKKPLKNGKKRVCELVWSSRLLCRRDLNETGHLEVYHMVVKDSPKCCAARVFGAKDKVSGMICLHARKSATAADAAAFLDYLVKETDGQIKSIQSDNGSEFKKEFVAALEARGIAHLLIPIASPTWNNMIENTYNMLRIRCINYGMDKVESIEALNEKLERVAFVYNHTPKDYLPPRAAGTGGGAPGSHLTPYQCHCLLNGTDPDIVIPFGPYEF